MRRLGSLPLVLIVAACTSNAPVRTKPIPVGASATKAAGPTLSSLGEPSPTPTPTTTATATPTPGTPSAQPSASATPTPTPSATPTQSGSGSSIGGVVYHNEPPQGTPPPVPPAAGSVSTYAGGASAGYVDAGAMDARFTSPYALAVQGTTAMYVADRGGYRIRRINLATRQVTTVAGSGVSGYRDAIGQQAQFGDVNGIALDANGMLYVADGSNNVIRKIDTSDLGTPNVTTLAGMQGAGGRRDGAGMQALFSNPWAMVVVGRTLYVADADNAQIRTVDLDAATVGTYAGTGTTGGADGAALSTATFTTPRGLALASDHTMYVADAGNHTIRRIDGPDANHPVTTVAGKGSLGFLDADGTNAAFNAPSGLAMGTDGNLYVADTGNHLLRKVDLASSGKTVTTWAGIGLAGFLDGPRASAKFSSPVGLAWLGSGLAIADSGNFRVRLLP